MGDTATTYMAMDRRQALAREASLPRTAQGSTLFADISGFTPLTELLAREMGPRRGAEELTSYLNQVYDALIAHVHRFGGSVTGFAGDAITCWFADDDGRRAVASGLAMQQAMAPFAQLAIGGGASISLAVKVAVAAGTVQRFVVGDPHDSLLDVLAGATLERLAATEKQAQTGEVIVHGQTAEALGQWLRVSGWRVDEEKGTRFAVVAALRETPPERPWAPLPPRALSDDQARPWLLGPIFRRLQAGQGEYLAELRTAVVLFLRFEGIDYDDDPQAESRLDAFVREVQAILQRHEGSLLQLTIGDKGSFLYAAFGAPVAHEDDVDRAAASALALRALPERLRYLRPFRMGITRGRMRVGAYGGAQRRTYGVLGDAVNLAARLMMAAQPGQILVSDEARAHAADIFVWDRLPAVRVKGKREVVPLNCLLRARRRQPAQRLEAAFPLPPLGRTRTMGQLQESLRALLNGRGQVVRLTGEAGTGKSHLAAELARQARAADVQVAYGAAQSVSYNIAYLPWRQIFYELLPLAQQDEAQVVAWLEAYLARQHPQWILRLPLLGDLLGLAIAENPATAALDSDVRQQALFSLLVEMVQNQARQRPMLLVVDNAQWMDEASRGLAQSLARGAVTAAPILLLLLERPGSDLEELAGAVQMTLGELEEATVADLIDRYLGGAPSPLLVSVMHQVARGNPFLVGELLAAMREAGQLAQEASGWQVGEGLMRLLQRANLLLLRDGEWRLTPGVDFSTVPLGLPDSIHGLILSRLDRLPEGHKLTLKVSGVVGHVVKLVLVAGAHPEQRSLPEIRSEAADLAAQAVLREEDPDRDVYAFRHHTTQEVVYETLLYNQRRQLHRAVARALLQEDAGAVSAIAYHAFLGEDWELALPYNLRAGEQAKQLHATQQSIDFLQKALHSSRQLLDVNTDEQCKRIHLALGELLVLGGRHEDAQRHLQAALYLAADLQDPLAQATAYRWQARSHEQRGDYAAALDYIEQGLAVLGDSLSPETAELDLLAGLIHARQGRFQQALALCQHSLRVGRQFQDTAIRARTYNLMGIVELRSNSSAAVERFQQSLEQYRALHDVYGQATSHNLIANGYFAMGQWSRADGHYRQALEHFTQIGNVYSQVLVSNNLGGIALKQGRLDEALGYYRRATSLLDQSGGSRWVRGALHLNTGNAHLQRGELQAAGQQLQLARADLDEVQARDLLPELLGLQAELALRRGELLRAQEVCEQSLEQARTLAMPREEGHNLRIRGEIALAQQQFEEAERYFYESHRTLQEAGDEYESARTRLSLASLFVERGQEARAQRELERCHAVFARLEARLDLERVQRLQQRLTVRQRSA